MQNTKTKNSSPSAGPEPWDRNTANMTSLTSLTSVRNPANPLCPCGLFGCRWFRWCQHFPVSSLSMLRCCFKHALNWEFFFQSLMGHNRATEGLFSKISRHSHICDMEVFIHCSRSSIPSTFQRLLKDPNGAINTWLSMLSRSPKTNDILWECRMLMCLIDILWFFR